MLTDDEDRQFTPADIAEVVVLGALMFGLFYLLDSFSAWVRIPLILLGAAAVLLAWRGVRLIRERRSKGD